MLSGALPPSVPLSMSAAPSALVGQSVAPAEQLLPVGAWGVPAFVDAAFLEDRYYKVDETLQTLGNNGAGEVEAVHIRLPHPGDQLVRNLLRRADDGRLAATEHKTVDKSALGPPRSKRGGDSLDTGADRLSGTCVDRFIHAVAGEIDAGRGCGMCQGAFDTGVAPVLRQQHARFDEHQLRSRRGASAQVDDEAADILFGAGVDEHALGVAGGEYPATV